MLGQRRDVRDFVAAQSTDSPLAVRSYSGGNRPRSITNFNAVKVEAMTLIVKKAAVAATFVE